MNRKQRRAGNATHTQRPESVQEIFARAVQFHHAGRLRDAEQSYRQVLAAQPGHADSLHRLGVIAYQAEQPASAVELIRKAITLNAVAASYHAHLGLALAALGSRDEAVVASRAALRLDPNQPDTQNNLGVLLEQQGELDQAEDCYRKAIALAPDFPNAHGNLGAVLRTAGKPVEAIACLRRALEIYPNQPEVLNNLALALLAQDDRRARHVFPPPVPAAHKVATIFLPACYRVILCSQACKFLVIKDHRRVQHNASNELRLGHPQLDSGLRARVIAKDINRGKPQFRHEA